MTLAVRNQRIRLGLRDADLEQKEKEMLDQEMQTIVTVNIRKVAENWSRPCVLFKPSLRFNDGYWDVYYDGHQFGTGLSPEAAMENFDLNWRAGTRLEPRSK